MLVVPVFYKYYKYHTLCKKVKFIYSEQTYSFLYNETFPVLVAPVFYKFYKYHTLCKKVKFIYGEQIYTVSYTMRPFLC